MTRGNVSASLGTLMKGLPMFLRFLVLLLSSLALSGCILQSEQPLFAEKDAVLALKPLGNTFATYNLVDGQWQEEKDRVTFNAKGKHYEAMGDDGKVTIITFVALDGNSWVMQAAEAGKPAVYVIARREGKALLLQAPACEDLKKSEVTAKRLRFEKDDCFAPADFKLAEFTALATALPPAKMKLLAE